MSHPFPTSVSCFPVLEHSFSGNLATRDFSLFVCLVFILTQQQEEAPGHRRAGSRGQGTVGWL